MAVLLSIGVYRLDILTSSNENDTLGDRPRSIHVLSNERTGDEMEEATVWTCDVNWDVRPDDGRSFDG
jgi:hypothetical protein